MWAKGFENKVLSGFEPKRDESGCGELELYCSPYVVRVVKSIKLGWAVHQEGRSAFKILTEETSRKT